MRKFKGLFFLIITTLILFVAIGCGGSKIELSFDESTYQVEVGKELTLNPTVKNEKNEEYELEFFSEDETIATYINGKVKGLKVGETKVKVQVKGNDKISAEATVKVVEATKFTVTFDTDGGSEIAAVQVTDGEKLTLPADPTKAGHVFAGWFTNAAKTIPFNKDVPITGNITLYAKWDVAEYTVTFESNGGTEVPATGVNHGDTVTRPTPPTREGYTFTGWFTDEELENEYDFSTEVTSDLTLYAGWEINTYMVMFNTDGGSTVDSQAVEFGGKVTKPEDPTKEDHIFAGWFKDANLTTEFDFEEEVVTADIIIYAKWEFDMTGKAAVEFELNGGEFDLFGYDAFLQGVPSSHALKVYNDPSIYLTYAASAVMLFDASLNLAGTGWAHKVGLKLNEAGFYEAVEHVPGSSTSSNDLTRFDMVIIAHDSYPAGNTFVQSIAIGSLISVTGLTDPKAGVVDATINAYPAGSGEMGKAILPEGAELPIPKKAEASFIGWFDNEELTGEPVTGAVSGKLYAKWGAPLRTVTYELNGGKFSFADKAEMVAEFMKDFNEVFGMDITADEFQAKTYERNVFTIFDHEDYGVKWVWMREYLIKVAEDLEHASAEQLKNNNDAFWRATIDSFLNDRVREAWPATVDFTNEELAEGFWYLLEPVVEFTRDTETFKLVNPMKDDHIFVGWYKNANFTGDPVTEIVKGTDANVTLYAKFVPITVDVTFVDGEEVEVVAVPKRTKATPLALDPKDGYIFVGWFVDEELTTKFNFDTVITEPITLYASWLESEVAEVDYQAVYNEVRGTWYIKVTASVDLDAATIKSIHVIFEADQEVEPRALTPDSDTVLWFGVALADGQLTFKQPGVYAYKVVTQEDEELVFGFYYDPSEVTGVTHTIEFESNEGSAVDAITIEKGEVATKPEDPTKEGFLFGGWFVDEELTTPYNWDAPVTKNLVLYAKWNYPPFSITYNLNGGEFIYPRFSSKSELADAFLLDFYNYLDLEDITLEVFMHEEDKPGEYSGKWLDYVATRLYHTSKEVDESLNLFINHPDYNQKWLPFFEMMQEFVRGVNSGQNFWGDTFVGGLRLPVWMSDARPWSYVPESVYTLFPEAYLLVKEYLHEGPEVVLPSDLVKEGFVFLGWYDNPDFEGDRMATIPVGSIGDLELYARWGVEDELPLNEVLVSTEHEDGATIQHNGMTFIMGKNGFATLEEALEAVEAGAIIYVLDGTHSEAVTVDKDGITIIGVDATITGTINVATGVDGLTIKGLTFTGKGQVVLAEDGGVKNFTFTENHVYDATTTVVNFKNNGTANNENIVITNNVFEVVELTTFEGRYIRGGNVNNLTITDNKFVGLRGNGNPTSPLNYVDAIRIEGTNEGTGAGIGASGVVTITDNEFINIGQRAIWLRRYSATQINIINNLFDWAGDQSYGGGIQLENWASGQTTVINIKENNFKLIEGYFYIRINNGSIAADATWVVNINYNFFAKPLEEGTNLYVQAYSEDSAHLINAENNLFEVHPDPERFVLVGSFSELITEDDVTYTVKFDTDGGTVIGDVIIKENRKVIKPADPVKEGYEFVGWYIDPARTVEYDFDELVTANLTLYAKWDEEEVEVVPTVAEVRAADPNDDVTTVGVVTVKIGNNAFIQDETAGIYVYVDGDSELGSELGDKLVVGNKVKVTGKRADFNQLVQISNVTEIEVLATDVDLPEAVVVTDLTTLLDYEGQLVTINGLTIKAIPNIGSGSYNVLVTNGTVDFDVRIDSGIGQYAEVKALFQSALTGLKINLVNVAVGRYYANAQVMASLVEQLQISDPTETEFEVILNPGEETDKDLELPTTITILDKEYTITWTSDDEEVISNAGVVVRQSEDTVVKLTAVVKDSNDEEVATVEFEVTVLAVVEGEQVIFETGFEDVTKGSYASGNVEIDGITWVLDDSLVGDLPNDKKNGSQSVRFQNSGILESKTAISNITKITFSMAYYGSETNGNITVQVSVDGENWVTVMGPIAATAVLTEQTVSLTDNQALIDAEITQETPLYIKFVKSGGKRVNLDDLKIYGLDS